MTRFTSLFTPLLQIPRWQKRLLSLVIDTCALMVIAYLALTLRFGELYWPTPVQWIGIPILPLVAIPVFIRLGLYRAVVRYIGVRFAYTVFLAVSIAFVLWTAVLFMLNLEFPRSAMIIAWLLALLAISGSRMIARSLLNDGVSRKLYSDKKRVVIYGAGSAGQQLFNATVKMPFVRVVGFIDDCPQLQNYDIHAVRVFKPEDLDELIEQQSVTDLFLAIPSLSPAKKKSILSWLEKKRVKVSILPPMDQIVGGQVQVSDVREVGIEDLLGRETVPPKAELLEHCVKDQVVLVSGAGGSIGSELCRQVVKLNPKSLILYELSEFALYQIDKELQGHGVDIVSILGSVQDGVKLEKILNMYSVDTVYHAAAYKHVPLVEHNIAEGIQNNSFGTMTIAKKAAESGVKNFVLISTDKAVRPTNFMGASKRMAELALQALQEQYRSTRFVMVRFGNVLGSSGSVIPLFRQQIKAGGPLTVTHPEITRFFMTIPEAASLVIQAGSMGTGGDVFVLDMGKSVKIVDLAQRMIRLSGLEVMDEEGNGDIEIQFTGLRPGEKLYEELLIGEDIDGTSHPKIMKAHEYFVPLEELETTFVQMKAAIRNSDYEQLAQLVGQVVSGFNHTSGIVDYFKVSPEQVSSYKKDLDTKPKLGVVNVKNA
ncbi:polysaccharide biosynthesis protein [Thiomicrorhabdus xiamenensis]|uniref:Polysaccharide biosynthesis protein n=1 Tax=Thiomicrorhabdus xiamenensis TaxID=2739063 RepID=A0A7D4SZB5_9GAMM|nr:nucleoside-diphosphate sugar epimerase/dehydratase [Thiomicrorhabdus xiamenensis]QKI89764.1 polysaccharide biosynthesis protein [Thiomicrorhabdus xiamenensis]